MVVVASSKLGKQKNNLSFLGEKVYCKKNKWQWGFCYNLGGDGNGGSSFVATIAIASLHLVVSAAQKEEKENN